MRIHGLHSSHPFDYSSNVYWVLGDLNQPSDLNTLVDAGSTHTGNLPYYLGEMAHHGKGMGKSAVEQVVITHGHYDHCGGLKALVEAFHPRVCAFGELPEVTRPLGDNDIVRMGDQDFTVLHTPGHSPDSVCLYCEAEGVLFSGDTLFPVTDSKGTYPRSYLRSLERLRFLAVRAIYPGHGQPITASPAGFIRSTLACVAASVLTDG